MAKKYSDIGELNTAWGTDYTNFNKLDYPPIFTTPNDFRVDEPTAAGRIRCEFFPEKCRLVDFIDWYRISMTEYCGEWLRLTRKYFPDMPVRLCVGGQGECWLASDLESLSKLAASFGAGLMFADYYQNREEYSGAAFRVASAGNFYGSDYAFGSVNPDFRSYAASMIFDASAAGAQEIMFLDPLLYNYIHGAKSRFIGAEDIPENIRFFRRGCPEQEIAVLYPDLPAIFNPLVLTYARQVMTNIRDFTDYKYVCDVTVADGILSTVKALFIIVGGVYRGETLHKIKKFVTAGGLLVVLGADELTALDGDLTGRSDFFEDMLRKRGNGMRHIGKGATLRLDLPKLFESEIAIMHNYLNITADFLRSHGVDLPDGRLDGILTVRKNGALMTYSDNEGIREFKADV
jgi:hypothetical protein